MGVPWSRRVPPKGHNTAALLWAKTVLNDVTPDLNNFTFFRIFHIYLKCGKMVDGSVHRAERTRCP